MNTLSRFTLKSYLPPLAMTFVISVFILFMQFLWKWVDELVGKGLDWDVISELFSFAALSMVPLALPMSVLLASLMTFGNLAEHYEMAALKSAGVSLLKVMKPLIYFTIVMTIGAFLFSNYLLPYTNLKMLSTLFDIRQQKPELNIPENVFYNQIDGYTIRVKHKAKDGVTLEDITIYDHTDQSGNNTMTIAKTGKMSMTVDKHYMLIELFNGNTYKDMMDQPNAAITHPFMRTSFKDQVLRLDLSGFKMTRTNEDLFKENQQMLNGDQLLAYIDTMHNEIHDDRVGFYGALKAAYFNKLNNYLNRVDSTSDPKEGSFLAGMKKADRKRIYERALNSARNCMSSAEGKMDELDAEEHSILRYKIEFWRKYTLSFACLVMFFVGAPLGAIVRKGGLGMPVVISVLFFIIFWVLSIIGEKLSKSGSLPPEIGMWLGCFFYIPIAIWLMRKAMKDADLFDLPSVRNAFYRLFTKAGSPHGLVVHEMKDVFKEEYERIHNIKDPEE